MAVKAVNAEAALQEFDTKEQALVDAFAKLYGYQLRRMDLQERLAVLYALCHPADDVDAFDKKWCDPKRGSVKTMIPPRTVGTDASDSMVVDGICTKTVFINTLPTEISSGLLSDLAAVSSRMVLSITYRPIDSKIGYQASAHRVRENTEVKTVAVRDTVLDRKNKRTRKEEIVLSENENEYFNRAALKLFTDARAHGHPVLMTSMVITLYADNMDDLERDYTLLRLSASKYACQIKSADLQQREAFVSVLPLCNTKINVYRTFALNQMVSMQPLSVNAMFERIKTVQGLNAINDNLVLLDRSNYLAGMICGTGHAGKSFACRREMLNALMTTNDEVIVLSATSEYADFVETLGGKTYPAVTPDPFAHDVNYNLVDDYEQLLATYLEAFITIRTGAYQSPDNTPVSVAFKALSEDDRQMVMDEIKAEAGKLAKYRDLPTARDHALNGADADEFKWFLKAVDGYDASTLDLGDERVKQITFVNATELLVMLDALWDYSVRRKKQNKNVWIFVDAVDDLIYSVAGSDYLVALIERIKNLYVPLTLVVQRAAHIVSNVEANIEFDYLLGKLDYYKLFSLGPVERKMLSERLNIPQTLLPYVTDREPGDGVIITPAANIAFSDRLFKCVIEKDKNDCEA